ncbi:uncharacterized protein N7469_009029 [Penicillium citrinum]|uniref:Kinesin light chain n=1 Tax=Penicillium citrinum TaxID=5077 RepID=A0A9W9NQH8_PENCI|nr:uncharacterized protein N7469_009029 [Penicillium citrinum]KAJ5222789.1 hypothetical protein N7469_009029 [Penicillium citrinum]
MDDEDVLRSTHRLALTYRKQEWWDKAEKLQIEVMEKYKGKPSDEDSDIDTKYGMRLLRSMDSLGRLLEAEKLCKEAMEMGETKLSNDDPEIPSTKNNLTSIYRSEAGWRNLRCCQLKYWKCTSTKKGDLPRLLGWMYNLAVVYSDQERWDEVEKIHRHMFETRKTRLGHNHPDTLQSMGKC